jgi:DNA-binding CsgD family transcriptional regulator
MKMTRSAIKSPDEVLGRLTAKQCACLDLVLQHQTSKQIAQTLGISPYTVDQRLDSARRILGTSTRLDAAIAYGKLRNIPESLVYERENSTNFQYVDRTISSKTPDRTVHEPFLLHPNGRVHVDLRAPDEEQMLHLAEAQFNDFPPPWRPDALIRPFAGPLAGTNGTVRRLVLILALSVLMMAVVILGLAVAQGIAGLLSHL